MRPPRILPLGLAMLVGVAAAPATAQAAGFGPVRFLSPETGIVDLPSAAIAPTGETAVMWRQGSFDTGYEYVVAMGPDAESLAPAQVLEPARGTPSKIAGATLLARPNGGFVVCVHGGDDHTSTYGCSFTDASGAFGPVREVQRRPKRDEPSYRVAMRSDGQLAIVLKHRVGKRRARLRTTTLAADGRRGPVRPLATVDVEEFVSPATTDDGITALAFADRRRGRAHRRRVVLRLTAPGGDVFGVPRSLPGDGTSKSLRSVGITGGRELRVHLSHVDGSIAGDVIVRRRTDGSFSDPLRLPRPAPGFLSGDVVSLRDGSTLAVASATRESQTDCSDVSAGVVGSGPLVRHRTLPRSTTQRLSRPGQIGFAPSAATLADGTVIAAWENGADEGGDTRLEVAIRPAGAARFRPSQVLPELSTSSKELATGGDQAILVWMTGDHVDGPSRVAVSSLRHGPPFAAPTALPKRPRMPCQ